MNTVQIARDVFQSTAWASTAAWARAEIEALREKNDLIALKPEETAALRGEIKALKRLLDQATPPAPVVTGAPVDYFK